MRTALRGFAGAAVLLAVLAGCADTGAAPPPTLAQQAQTNKSPSRAMVPQKLAPTGSAYVAMPVDGRHKGKLYDGSGRAVAYIVAGAFMRRLGHVEQAERPQDYEQALAAARNAGATYLILPEIARWVDHSAKSTSRPDRADVRLRIVDTASENLVASGRFRARSDAATPSGTRPEDLLLGPAEDYVASLF